MARVITFSPSEAYAPVSPYSSVSIAIKRPSRRAPSLIRIWVACRFGCTRKLSWRSNNNFTGRPVIWVSKEAWICPAMSSFPPKPPPTSIPITRTRSSGQSNARAIWLRSAYAICEPTYNSIRPSGVRRAILHSGSMKACSVVAVKNVCSRITSASANPTSTLPLRTLMCLSRLPLGCKAVTAGSRACTGSEITDKCS